MRHEIISVNTGLPREVRDGNRVITTGIFKSAVPGSVAVLKMGLRGDGQADLTVHGGVDKAVYAYPAEHYAYWERELGRELKPGTFGENLTVAGLDEAVSCIGDVFRVGSATCQVTQPRAPCFKLALRMGMPAFPRLFLRSLRTGFYLRVLQEGTVGAGDTMECLHRADGSMTVRDLTHLAFFARDDTEGNLRASAIEALPRDWREEFSKRAGIEQDSPA